MIQGESQSGFLTGNNTGRPLGVKDLTPRCIPVVFPGPLGIAMGDPHGK